MRQRRVAGAENPVAAKIDAKLLGERLLHIDFGDYAEALTLERRGRAPQRLFKADRQRGAEIIAHDVSLRR
jgi:hypothetical protein